MIFAIASLVLVSLPFAIDLYFSTRDDSKSAEEEYVPDGR
jgi:hypothetical protein